MNHSRQFGHQVFGHSASLPDGAVPLPTIKVFGSDRLLAAVTDLIEASAWFEVMPLPDDYWNVTVKNEELPIEIVTRQQDWREPDSWRDEPGK